MKINKKKLLATILYYSGFFFLCLKLKKTSALSILAYHRVLDIDSNYQYDRELISASTAQFTWQVNFLKKYYNVISFQKLSEILNQNETVPANSLIITFDDGFEDNYTHAFKILKRYGLPATFFIATDYIDQHDCFWFDAVVKVVNSLPDNDYYLKEIDYRFTIAGADSKINIYKKIQFQLKRLENYRRLRTVQEVLELMPECDFSDNLPMTWEQIQEMKDFGMEFGSHTLTHPVLSRLAKEEIYDELSNSKEHIEKKLNVSVQAIAYPVGGDAATNEDVISIASECGYDFGCVYSHGVNFVTLQLNQFKLKRLQIERYTTNALFIAQLLFPKFF